MLLNYRYSSVGAASVRCISRLERTTARHADGRYAFDFYERCVKLIPSSTAAL